MILHFNPLSHPTTKLLRDWLTRPEFDTLIKVLESKAFILEIEAMNIRKDSPGNPQMTEKVTVLQQRADKVNATIKLLQEIRSEETFKTATSTP